MPDVPTLPGARLTLRPPTEADAVSYAALAADPVVLEGYGMTIADIPERTAEGAQGWLREQRAAMSWVIDIDGAMAGTVRLHSLAPQDARAEMAIGFFSSAYIGRGHGREAIGLLLGHAFGAMGLHRVGLRVIATNARAIACYGACGLRQEGVQREAAATADGWVDDVMMGILAQDWRAQVGRAQDGAGQVGSAQDGARP